MTTAPSLFFTVCQSSKYDVGFLLSSPDTAPNYRQRIKDFMKGIVKSLVVGENNTRFGMVTYSSRDQQTLVFPFDTYFNTSKVSQTIQNVDYHVDSTFTGAALNFTREKLFPTARKGFPHLLLVLADSGAVDNVTYQSELLRNTGVILYSVGIGSSYNMGQLNTMATDPDADHVLNATLGDLFGLINQLHEKICKGERLFVCLSLRKYQSCLLACYA